MLKTSVILPTYNERKNLPNLIREILERVSPTEIIVVDDNSPDKTWEIVEKFGDSRVRLIRRIKKKGLTSAIKDGIDASTGDVVVWMDADFSMPPSVIPELLRAIEESDIAIGSRYVNGAKDNRYSFRERAGSWIINRFAKLFLDRSINDYTTGFVAARKRVFDCLSLKGDYGEYCIDFLYRAKKKGFKIEEVPYVCISRREGESKTATNLFKYFKRGIRYLNTLFILKFSWREDL